MRMKKKIIVGVLFLWLFFQAGVASPGKVSVVVDDREIQTSRVQVVLDGAIMAFDVPPVIYEDRTMVPLRFIIEALGGEVTWDQDLKKACVQYESHRLDVFLDQQEIVIDGEKKSMPYGVPAKLMGIEKNGQRIDRTMVPLRFISEFMACDVAWDGKRYEAVITKKKDIPKPPPSSKEVIYDAFEGKDFCLHINLPSDKKVKDFVLTEPDRIVLDVYDYAIENLPAGFLQEGGLYKKMLRTDFAESIRLYNDREAKKMRLIIDLKEKVSYQRESSEGQITLRLLGVSSQEEETEKEPINLTSSDLERIETKTKKGKDYLEITLKNKAEYHLLKLENPDRLVIDIMNSKFDKGFQKMDLENHFLKGVRMSQFNPSGHYSENIDVIRVVLDLKRAYENLNVAAEQNIIRVYRGDMTFQPGGTAPVKKKIYDWTAHAEGGVLDIFAQVDPNYLFYDEDKRELKLKLNQTLEGFDTENVFGADTLLREFYMGNQEGERYFGFRFHHPISFTADKSADHVRLIISRKKISLTGKKILIDAGHGGKDPGAISPFTGTFEKDLTIKVAQYLETYLKQMGYETYMIRKKDESINKYERAALANQVGGDLFISIHFNALYSEKMRGIMTLYCPSYESEIKEEYHQYTFSKILHQNLISMLSMEDLKIRQRSGVVVLRETKMVAALAELGCMTHREEEALIRTDDYQNRAAKVLAQSIDEYFKFKAAYPNQ